MQDVVLHQETDDAERDHKEVEDEEPQPHFVKSSPHQPIDEPPHLMTFDSTSPSRTVRTIHAVQMSPLLVAPFMATIQSTLTATGLSVIGLFKVRDHVSRFADFTISSLHTSQKRLIILSAP